jgi:hypothetical protein
MSDFFKKQSNEFYLQQEKTIGTRIPGVVYTVVGRKGKCLANFILEERIRLEKEEAKVEAGILDWSMEC